MSVQDFPDNQGRWMEVRWVAMSEAIEFDSPWKEGIRLFLRSFLRLCFAKVERAINWNRAPEFLDKELQQISPDADAGKQFVDVLAKVWFLNGAEEWFLLHLEVQHRSEAGFGERLFHYFCSIRLLYQRKISTLVILADTDARWRPDHYELESPGSRVRFDFSTCKLLDLTRDRALLQQSREPAAIMVLANWAVQQTGKDEEQRLALKWDLTRRLYELGFAKLEIQGLYRLIDWLLRLPNRLEERFRQQLRELETAKVMPYITSIERMGIEQGRKEGLEEGLERGRLLNLRENILDLLVSRFGDVPYSVKERVAAESDLTLLRSWLRQAAMCGRIEDFNNHIRAHPN